VSHNASPSPSSHPGATEVPPRAVAALIAAALFAAPAGAAEPRPPDGARVRWAQVQAQASPAPSGPASAPSAPVPATATARPRIGLALSGGGARGFAHVGVLRALEAMRVPVDCIAGTSAGSAVGAAYSSGLSPDDIERELRSVDWDRDMFDDLPPRRDQQARRKNEEKAYLLDLTVGIRGTSVLLPPGLISGQKIELFLHRMLGSSALLESFDALPIPFRAIATDLEVGEMVVQDRGSLPTAVRASMAVPSAFAPVQSQGRLLVDGGLTRNMPVDVVRSMCADVVIAVDIGSPLLGRDGLADVFGVASQMISILMERNMRESRDEVRAGIDVMIRPDLGDIGATSFSRGVDGIPAGESAARAASAELERLAMTPEAYASWQQSRASRVVRDDRYVGVRVAGVEPAAGRSLLAQAGVPTSGTLDRTSLDRTINTWNSSGDYDRIGYALVPGPAGQTLELDVVEKAWGPNFLRFGLGAATDSNANGIFNILLGFRRPGLNAWGGEFKAQAQFGTTSRLQVELHQPVNRGDARFFVAPQLLAEEVPVWIFDGRQRVGEYGVSTGQLGLDVGVQGRVGEVRLGVFQGVRKTAVRIGPESFPQFDTNYTGAQISLIGDQLDATDFPRDGWVAGLVARWEDVDPDLGDSATMRKVQAFGKQVGSWGPHTVSATFRAGEADGLIPLNQLFSLGGFGNMAGLQINQILGRSLRYGSLGWQYQLLTLPNPVGRGLYAGLTLEGGQMRGRTLGLPGDEWIGGVAAYLGAATAIGPVYLGYGYAGSGNRLVYLFLGRPGL
jgi:NTE family protein